MTKKDLDIFLALLIRDCEQLVDNISNWKQYNDELMIEETINNIKQDIVYWKQANKDIENREKFH